MSESVGCRREEILSHLVAALVNAGTYARADIGGGHTVIFTQHFDAFWSDLRNTSPPARMNCADGYDPAVFFCFKKNGNAIGGLLQTHTFSFFVFVQ